MDRPNPHVVRLANDAATLLEDASRRLRQPKSSLTSDLLVWFAVQHESVQHAILGTARSTDRDTLDVLVERPVLGRSDVDILAMSVFLESLFVGRESELPATLRSLPAECVDSLRLLVGELPRLARGSLPCFLLLNLQPQGSLREIEIGARAVGPSDVTAAVREAAKARYAADVRSLYSTVAEVVDGALDSLRHAALGASHGNARDAVERYRRIQRQLLVLIAQAERHKVSADAVDELVRGLPGSVSGMLPSSEFDAAAAQFASAALLEDLAHVDERVGMPQRRLQEIRDRARLKPLSWNSSLARPVEPAPRLVPPTGSPKRGANRTR